MEATKNKKQPNSNPSPMANIRESAQRVIEEKGLSEEEIRKSLGMKRYEKK